MGVKLVVQITSTPLSPPFTGALVAVAANGR
jgi:hypothetical protein